MNPQRRHRILELLRELTAGPEGADGSASGARHAPARARLRAHLPPDPDCLHALQEALGSLGLTLDVEIGIDPGGAPDRPEPALLIIDATGPDDPPQLEPHHRHETIPIVALVRSGAQGEPPPTPLPDFVTPIPVDPPDVGLITALVRLALERRDLRDRVDAAAARQTDAAVLGGAWWWEWRRETHELEVAPELLERLGWDRPPRDRRLPGWGALVLPSDVRDVHEIVRRHLEDGSDAFSCRVHLRQKSGGFSRLECRGRVLRSPAGEVTRVGGVLRMALAAAPSDVPGVGAAISPTGETGTRGDWSAMARLVLPDVLDPLKMMAARVRLLRRRAGFPADSENDWLLTDIGNQIACAQGYVRYLLEAMGKGKPALEEPDTGANREDGIDPESLPRAS